MPTIWIGWRASKSAGRAINPTRLLLPPMPFPRFGVGGVEERADDWCSPSVVPARCTGSSDFSFPIEHNLSAHGAPCNSISQALSPGLQHVKNSNAPPAASPAAAAFGAQLQSVSHRVIASRHSVYCHSAFRAAIDSDQGAALHTPYDPASSSRK